MAPELLTFQGGMKAVMWTDVFQIIIMFGGMSAVIIQGSIDHGGFGNIWKMMEEGDRIHFWEWVDDTYSDRQEIYFAYK